MRLRVLRKHGRRLPVQLPARGQRRRPEACRRAKGPAAVADGRAGGAAHGNGRRGARVPRLHDRAAAAHRRAVETGQAGGCEVVAVDASQADRRDHVKPARGKDGGKRPALPGREERDKAARTGGLSRA